MDFALAGMAYPVLVVVLGYVALGLTGFASALISVPLRAWRWPLVEVVPLVLAWLARRGFDARAMRATTPALAVLATLAMMVVNGRLSSPALWQRLTRLLPIAVVGVVAGHALAHRVPTEALRRVICALLVASAAMLMLNAINRMV